MAMTGKSGWVVRLTKQASKELQGQPESIKAKFLRLKRTIESKGLNAIPPKSIKHLRGEIWELRLTGKDTITRALYLTWVGERVIVVRVFTKKDPKTPPSEIKLALKRAKEFKDAW